METLAQSLPYADKIVGVGLDSDERGNPPLKFAGVFARARAEGYRLTMHCDVDQEDAVGHIWQCLDEIGVERIDHGVNCLEDAALVARLAADRIGLTVCPVSNGWVTDSMKVPELGDHARQDAAGHGELRRPGLLRGVRERELRRGGRATAGSPRTSSPSWPATRSRSPGSTRPSARATSP